jgi:pSer/pThr/pTyr-binding forkhead associated (FHA) protein
MLETAGGVMADLADHKTAPDQAQRPQEPYLAYWSTGAQQRTWTLSSARGTVTIGRSASTDVSISWDPQVSRVHATLERVGTEWTLADNGLSRNGTFVNGRRLMTRVRLCDRDQIVVGGTVLTFCAPPQAAVEQTVVREGLTAKPHLTEPQRAVLVALCRPYRGGRGYATPASNQQISEELTLSLDAVKTHLRMLFHKFGIEALPQNRKRAQLVEMALSEGLVTQDDL